MVDEVWTDDGRISITGDMMQRECSCKPKKEAIQTMSNERTLLMGALVARSSMDASRRRSSLEMAFRNDDV